MASRRNHEVPQKNKDTSAVRLYRSYRAMFDAAGPKYAKLRAVLEAALNDGFWTESERLPTEHEIADATGMSLGTIQRALRELVTEGRLMRIAGRGTFVLKNRYSLGGPFVGARFLSDDGASILPVEATLVEYGFVDADGVASAALRPSDTELYRIERIFDVNRRFRVLSRFYVDPARFPGVVEMTSKELRTPNLKAVLARMHSLPTVTHHQTMRFNKLPADVCATLNYRRGTVGLLQSITALIRDGDAVYFHELYIPPNHQALELPPAVLSREA